MAGRTEVIDWIPISEEPGSGGACQEQRSSSAPFNHFHKATSIFLDRLAEAATTIGMYINLIPTSVCNISLHTIRKGTVDWYGWRPVVGQ